MRPQRREFCSRCSKTCGRSLEHMVEDLEDLLMQRPIRRRERIPPPPVNANVSAPAPGAQSSVFPAGSGLRESGSNHHVLLLVAVRPAGRGLTQIQRRQGRFPTITG